MKKQNKHIEGTEEYKKAIKAGNHPSRLTIDSKEQQRLVDKYVKEGKATKRGDGSIRIKFTHGEIIGVCVSEDGSKEQNTNTGMIHFSKTGTHIVPDIPKKG